MSRLSSLEDQRFDVLVIGGGIAGAGVARDLALRGASVALFDKGDFGWGTTSRSSKLIHGGLRYLELFDFGLVRESLRERETLRRLVPHLIRPLPFLIPIYRGASRGRITVRFGLKLYDWLTPGKSTDRYRVIRPEAALALEPEIHAEDLLGAGFYVDDLLLFPERLCLENILSARRHGARAFNYTEVEAVLKGPQGIEGLRIRDLLTDQVRPVHGRVIVNAAGPWVDQIRALAGVGDRGAHVIRSTKGIHCVLPRLTDHAVYLPTKDERMIFVIPWREFSLVGTTDTDFDGDPDRLWATKEDVAYLLREVRRLLPDRRLTPTNVMYTYAGIRPLTYEAGKSPSKISRQHRVWSEGAGGKFLTITGTKLTCFRSLAEEVADLTMKRLGRRVPARTARLTLDGADERVRPTVEVRARMDVSGEMAATGLPRETIEMLLQTYGRNYVRVLDLARKLPDGCDRLCLRNAEIVAQLYYAVAEELAISLQDFLLRRSGIGTSSCQGLDCAERITARMGDLLGWNARRREAELAAYHDEVRRSHRFKEA